jgi:PTS system galactitol-specific IIA component
MKTLVYYVEGSKEEILSFLSDELQKAGYVKEGYKESLIKREQEHPTGLGLPNSINVAIPHTETDLANENVFVIAIPKNEVKFKKIDDENKEISVDLIFLFVIKDPNTYLKLLARLTENFSDFEFTEYIKEKDLNKILTFLNENVLSEVD